MIKVRNLGYQIGKKLLVQDLNFQAQQGELLAILGANGAGKSTLLKLLSRDILPYQGNIFFGNKALEDYTLDELARKRAVLMQQNQVSLGFASAEIVMMGRYPYFQFHPSFRDEQICYLAMQKTGVAHLAYRSYHTLSGGEQQRVQFARALAQVWEHPDSWLLLDEPTTGLDLLHQQEMISTAHELSRKGYGVIAILHDLNLAMQYADKVLIMREGKLLSWGTPAQVLTCETIHQAFDLPVRLIRHPELQCPMIVPCPLNRNL
ncbi:heme ABC transporter ATP-binding protein [Thermoflexibacter ruber]|uniref:Iron complex transport system ATP-binding protein n=1 Tax=Thermoflexibacter ruber TaxID=1003 RepID=A0A1I2JW82_9BACT|nr:heme ABC transporter ATP-binding protein [Thermoflexibacter ruber]SFF57307.1 iron complex transport system ATP-binding protein [Thermoflexibacter ruber]